MLSPISRFETAGDLETLLTGRSLFRKGELGCLILAGGEGVRLGFDGPKGAFPITLIKKKSLFELLCQKIGAASKRAGVNVPVAVMTSPWNDAPTREFFQKNNHFGLRAQDLFFFTQGTLPLLDREKHPLSEEGADGNGYSLKKFCEAGLEKVWAERGVKYLHVCNVDNPLADPCDEELLGCAFAKEADAAIKCIRRKGPEEKMGVLALQKGQVRVVEYSELPVEVDARFSIANAGMFLFSMEFVRRCARISLPIHLAEKKRGACTVFKQETFIFDLLPFAQKVAVIVYPREGVFAPLKNRAGDDSIQTVQEALAANDRRILQEITGKEPPSGPFELDPAFYYPTEELKNEWLGKKVEGGYVEFNP